MQATQRSDDVDLQDIARSFQGGATFQPVHEGKATKGCLISLKPHFDLYAEIVYWIQVVINGIPYRYH